MGEVIDSKIQTLIAAGETDEAVRHALQVRVAKVTEQLEYDTLDEHADNASAFVQRWVRALEPGERVEAALWASGQYVTALVHVEGAYGIAAQLMLEAQQAAATQLAVALREFSILTEGPDSEIVPTVAERFNGYADQLDVMDFTPY